MIEKAWRISTRYLNRASTAISTNDNITKKTSRVSRLGPCLKNRGAISIIPQFQNAPFKVRGTGAQPRVQKQSITSEYADQLIHVFQRDTRPPHHAGKRVFRNNDRQACFFH